MNHSKSIIIILLLWQFSAMNENKGNAHRSTVSRPSHHGIQSTGGSKRWNSIDRQTSPQNRIVGFLWMPPYTQVVSLDFAKRDRTNKQNKIIEQLNASHCKANCCVTRKVGARMKCTASKIWAQTAIHQSVFQDKCCTNCCFFLNQLRQLGVDTAVARHAISKWSDVTHQPKTTSRKDRL